MVVECFWLIIYWWFWTFEPWMFSEFTHIWRQTQEQTAPIARCMAAACLFQDAQPGSWQLIAEEVWNLASPCWPKIFSMCSNYYVYRYHMEWTGFLLLMLSQKKHQTSRSIFLNIFPDLIHISYWQDCQNTGPGTHDVSHRPVRW